MNKNQLESLAPDERMKQITKIANIEIHERYPMMISPIKDWMVEIILRKANEIRKDTG